MATCMKTQCDLKRWLKEFHISANRSFTGSVEYLKTFSTLILSRIIYSKDIYPKTSFIIEKYKGNTIPMLKKQSNCQDANKFYSGIVGFHHAIEKKYLRRVILTFYDQDNPNQVIEESTIGFKYRKEKAKETSSCYTDLKENTLEYLTKITQPNDMDKQPINYNLMIKLMYYDNVTPVDYEPPGYYAYNEEDRMNKDINNSVLVGSYTSTAYHRMIMTLKYKTDNDLDKPEVKEPGVVSFEYVSDEEVKKTDAPYQIHDSPTYDDPGPVLLGNDLQELFDGNLFGETNYFNWQGNAQPNNDVDSDKLMEKRLRKLTLNRWKAHENAVDVEEDKKIQCPCAKNFYSDTVQCLSCKTYQHISCFGFMKVEDISQHHCDRCAMEKSEILCSEPEFAKLERFYKKKLCLFRNALLICKRQRFMSVDILIEELKVSKHTAVNLMNKFDKLNLFEPTSGNSENSMPSRLVNNSILTEKIIPKYFKSFKVPTQVQQQVFLDKFNLHRNKSMDNISESTPNVLAQKDIDGYLNAELVSSCEETNKDFKSPIIGQKRSFRIRKPTVRFTPEETPAKRRKTSATCLTPAARVSHKYSPYCTLSGLPDIGNHSDEY